MFDEVKDQVNKKRFEVDEKTIQVNQFEFKDQVNDQVKDKVNDQVNERRFEVNNQVNDEVNDLLIEFNKTYMGIVDLDFS